jgi:hypothetical protein
MLLLQAEKGVKLQDGCRIKEDGRSMQHCLNSTQ